MTVIWHFYWPLFAAAGVIGLLVGTYAFRPAGATRKLPRLAWGAAACLVLMALWHFAGGAEKRLAVSIERAARVTLDDYEMTQVSAKLERAPLKRTLILSGPGDDFQQREMVRIMNQVPGVATTKWDRPIEREKPQ